MNPNNQYKNLTASGQLKNMQGVLVGMYVNSTTDGTVKLWDSRTASGTVINNTITPTVGYHPLGSSNFSTGLFATLSGTIDVTFYFQ